MHLDSPKSNLNKHFFKALGRHLMIYPARSRPTSRTVPKRLKWKSTTLTSWSRCGLGWKPIPQNYCKHLRFGLGIGQCEISDNANNPKGQPENRIKYFGMLCGCASLVCSPEFVTASTSHMPNLFHSQARAEKFVNYSPIHSCSQYFFN